MGRFRFPFQGNESGILTIKNRFFHNPQRLSPTEKWSDPLYRFPFLADFQIFLRKDCLMGAKGAREAGWIHSGNAPMSQWHQIDAMPYA